MSSKKAKRSTNKPLLHGYSNDFNRSIYDNPAAVTMRKIKEAEKGDPNPPRHSQLPHPLNLADVELIIPHHNGEVPRSPGADRRRTLRYSWNKIGGPSQPSSSFELDIVKDKIADLFCTPWNEFISLLHGIQHRMNQLRYRRDKVKGQLLLQLQERMETREKDLKPKARWKKGLHKCSLHTPGFASVFYYTACFHLLAVALAALVHDRYEREELVRRYPSSKDELFHPFGPTSRVLGAIGLGLMALASILGILGHVVKKLYCVAVSFVILLIGLLSYAAQTFVEFEYAEKDWIASLLKKQLGAYRADARPKARSRFAFLWEVQEEFRCCGHSGIKDYIKAKELKVMLPKTCCEQVMRKVSADKCFFERSLDGSSFKIPIHVHENGCVAPVRTFLLDLFSIKSLFAPVILICFLFVLASFANLIRVYSSIRRALGGGKVPIPKRVIQSKGLAHATRSMGEIFLQTIEIATTGTGEGNPLESVPGTIDYYLRRLSDSKDMSDWIPALVEVVHLIDSYVASCIAELPTTSISADADVIARVLLGLRPRRFASDTLIHEKFNEFLRLASVDPESRDQVAKFDILLRLDMQSVRETKEETLDKLTYHLKRQATMQFPLPRPLVGYRKSEWQNSGASVGGTSIVREDKFFIKEGEVSDAFDPHYLEEDRVLSLFTLPKHGVFLRLFLKLFQREHRMGQDEYSYLEEGLYGPAVETLSYMITECQTILQELASQEAFQKVVTYDVDPVSYDSKRPTDLSLLPSATNVGQTSSMEISSRISSPAPVLLLETEKIVELDLEKVCSVLKELCEKEAEKERQFEKWILEKNYKKKL